MKDLLDRHVETLTPEERRVIERVILGATTKSRRIELRWALAAAAMFVAGLITFELVRLKPTHPESPAPRRDDRAGVAVVEPRRHEAPRVAPAKPAGTGRPEHQEREALRAALDRALASIPMTDTIEFTPVPKLPAGHSSPAPLGPCSVTGTVTDADGNPLPFVNVIALRTKLGSMTDEHGRYRIVGLEPGRHTLQVQSLGFQSQSRDLDVAEGSMAIADVKLNAHVVKTLESIEVRAEERIDTRASTTKQSISAEKLRQVPALRSVRGGRKDETQLRVNNITQPPVVPTTGGTRLPNDEAYDSMFFRTYGVNPFITTDEDSLSTFAVDVDAASYTLTRRYLELGHLPPPEAVRVEEFVNFFAQGYPRFETGDFRIVTDGAPSPFGKGLHLLRIGIKGREISDRNRKPAQLTFVIDISGSMQREDRLELVKRALRILVDRLRDDDRIGIVVYGDAGRVLLEPVKLERSGRRTVLDAIDQLGPGGSTNAEEGLRLGYDMARRAYRPGALNRVVLCSDGVANVGITGPERMLEQARSDADRGIHLTTIGFGMGNYNDVLMEQLADRGDGNYYYVDDLDEARRVFVEHLAGTLQTIAKDAKVQVEFDPSRVARYRLLGFENRDVADRDFRNDKVDAGEIGAGHEVTALYEVKLAPHAETGRIATVRLRYARPEHENGGAADVREIVAPVDAAALSRRLADASPRIRLDAAVAEFAEILRGSYWAKEGRLSEVLSLARRAAADLHDPAADEFVTLVERAARLGMPGRKE